jgi:hypothetical protein
MTRQSEGWTTRDNIIDIVPLTISLSTVPSKETAYLAGHVDHNCLTAVRIVVDRQSEGPHVDIDAMPNEEPYAVMLMPIARCGVLVSIPPSMSSLPRCSQSPWRANNTEIDRNYKLSRATSEVHA